MNNGVTPRAAKIAVWVGIFGVLSTIATVLDWFGVRPSRSGPTSSPSVTVTTFYTGGNTGAAGAPMDGRGDIFRPQP